MDSGAVNYDQFADIDNGSCIFSPWEIIPTDCNMTVLIQADANITVEGNVVSDDIWVGAFNQNDLCVGSILITPGTVNSIALWGAEAGEENGLQPGEEITWAVHYNGEEIAANVQWSFGQSTYSCNALSGLNVINLSLIHI